MQKIEDLDFSEHDYYSRVKRIAHDVDHLAFRISNYYGFFFNSVKEAIGKEAAAKYYDIQNNE